MIMESFDRLKAYLSQYENAAVAYSGGLDSSVLLRAAAEVYPDVTAITYYSVMHPIWERENAAAYAASLNVKSMCITSDIIACEDVSSNLPSRCYYCKRLIYKIIKQTADDYGMQYVLDGSNADDTAGSTPGVRAGREIGIISPLADCGFTKTDILKLADILDIPASNRSTYACLASRLPLGEHLSYDKLKLVERAELLMHKYGYDTVRVRMQGYMAKIELPKKIIIQFMLDKHFDEIYSLLIEMGFDHVCVDMGGYLA